MNGGLFNDISVDEIRNVFGDGIGMRKCVVRIAGSQVFTTLFKMKHLKYNASIYERHFIPGVTPVNKSPVEFILNDKKEKIFTFLASEGMSTILGELAKEYPALSIHLRENILMNVDGDEKVEEWEWEGGKEV